jgi:excisionase family DNA binding protein
MGKMKVKKISVVNPLGELYTTDEAAEFLKVNVRTILREIERGNLKAKKIGKGFRITRQSLEEYWQKAPAGGELPAA